MIKNQLKLVEEQMKVEYGQLKNRHFHRQFDHLFKIHFYLYSTGISIMVI